MNSATSALKFSSSAAVLAISSLRPPPFSNPDLRGILKQRQLRQPAAHGLGIQPKQGRDGADATTAELGRLYRRVAPSVHFRQRCKQPLDLYLNVLPVIRLRAHAWILGAWPAA